MVKGERDYRCTALWAKRIRKDYARYSEWAATVYTKWPPARFMAFVNFHNDSPRALKS